jgi:predicted homoserine dehydrogenase-like protein
MGIWSRWNNSSQQARVAILGAGFIGRGTVHRLSRTRGMSPALVVNRNVENAVLAYKLAGKDPGRVLVSDDPGELGEAIASGRDAVSTVPQIVSELDDIDVVVEATGALDYGARAVLDALEGKKHVVSMNAEVDATIGHLLQDAARRSGVVYTISDGDQPGVMLRHMEFVEGMGFETTAAINCKRNLNIHQSPDDSRAYASRDNTSVLMTTAFGDGTKMQIENAVVANLTGLVPEKRGMHGIPSTLETAAEDIMAVIGKRGVVEYTLGGDFGGGVGIVGYADDPEMVQPYMRYSKMGDGPDYFFFRPYHLIHNEVPVSIAEVMLDGEGLGTPTPKPVAEVVAMAKRPLKPGEALDGIGGFCSYGYIDTAENARGLLPMGLAEHARVTRPVEQDEPIALDDVELDTSAEIVKLRRAMDDGLAGT